MRILSTLLDSYAWSILSVTAVKRRARPDENSYLEQVFVLASVQVGVGAPVFPSRLGVRLLKVKLPDYHAVRTIQEIVIITYNYI